MIRRLARQYELTVAIGSAERKGERRNPFSGGERRAMLRAYLGEARVAGVRIVTVRDGPSVSWSLRTVLRRCDPDVLFLSTEKRGLARIARRWVKVVPFARTGTVSSTRIRNAIAAGRGRWEHLTGGSVVAWIRRHDGVGTIRRAYGRGGRVRLRTAVR